ncbi:hypothetical protein FRC98_09645 [Lujinxingia vulgaris]|uniref:Uncharacterized protein n=1 Tax=Lujinxingia vulgaris TaxID=2600176 RepID=A0A5C6XHL7_9DELT|nr:hypothetical protein [Lujinxingia vulgaris]TXD36995.1 hypothetical protein FRC98_09645 [Lujinxingia vulgaris]
MILRRSLFALITTSHTITACDASPEAENAPVVEGQAAQEQAAEDQIEPVGEPETSAESAASPASADSREQESENQPEPPCFIPDEATYGSLDLRDSNLTIALAADLNGDGRLEVLVPKRSTCRDFAVCPTDVLRTCEGGGYEVIAELTYFLPGGITVGPGSNRGWSDLHVSTAQRDAEGLWETTPVRFVWDGETYVGGEVEK